MMDQEYELLLLQIETAANTVIRNPEPIELAELEQALKELAEYREELN